LAKSVIKDWQVFYFDGLTFDWLTLVHEKLKIDPKIRD
jgi:hypothetical protein